MFKAVNNFFLRRSITNQIEESPFFTINDFAGRNDTNLLTDMRQYLNQCNAVLLPAIFKLVKMLAQGELISGADERGVYFSHQTNNIGEETLKLLLVHINLAQHILTHCERMQAMNPRRELTKGDFTNSVNLVNAVAGQQLFLMASRPSPAPEQVNALERFFDDEQFDPQVVGEIFSYAGGGH